MPVLVDAGVGTATDAAMAMELGCDGVLMNTAIAEAKEPVLMARAMKAAVEAGRLAYLAGRMQKRRYADPSSPLAGLILSRRDFRLPIGGGARKQPLNLIPDCLGHDAHALGVAVKFIDKRQFVLLAPSGQRDPEPVGDRLAFGVEGLVELTEIGERVLLSRVEGVPQAAFQLGRRWLRLLEEGRLLDEDRGAL